MLISIDIILQDYIKMTCGGKMFRVSICEDDKYQMYINKLLINKWGEKNDITIIISEFFSAEEFIIKNESILTYDCIIIDVRLKVMNGIELARVIREKNKDISIIFVSGLEEYISCGYDFEAIHYLIKPINEEKFFLCLDKAWSRKSLYKEDKNIISVKRFGDIISLKFTDILYCESHQHYIEINTKDNKVTIKKKISDLEKELDENLFIRTHRSYIVNISYTKEIKKNSILLKNDIEIPVSKMKKNKVKELYFKYF